MKTEPQKTLLSVPLPNESLDSSLEKIFLYIKNTLKIFHIVSLNPEIFALAEKNVKFKKVFGFPISCKRKEKVCFKTSVCEKACNFHPTLSASIGNAMNSPVPKSVAMLK